MLLRSLLLCVAAVMSSAHAEAPKPSCTIDGITNNCKFFNENPNPYIPLKDGTVIPNFGALRDRARDRAAQPASARIQGGLAQTESIEDRMVTAQLEITQALDRVPDQKINPKAKLSLTNFSFTNGGTAIQRIFKADRQDDEIFIVWPLDTGTQVKKVAVRDARSAIESVMTSAELGDLKSAINRFPTVRDANRPASEGERADPLRDVTPERRKHVDSLILRTKTLVKDEIRGNRTDAQLTPAEQDAIKKIEQIEIGDFATLENHPACQDGPQAFYDPMKHSINICPSFYNMPDSTIVSVVGHELGHSIDACLSQFGVAKLNREAILQAIGKDGVPSDPEMAKNNEVTQALTMLRAFVGRGVAQTALPLPMMYSKETLALLAEKGLITPTANGTPMPQYFLKDAYECLRTQGGFRSNTPEEMRRMANQVTLRRAEERGPSYDRAADEERVFRAFSSYPECVGGEKHSEMGEVMGDYLGAKVLGRFLSEPKPTHAPTRSPEDLIAPVSFFASLACAKRTTPEPKSDREVLEHAYRDFYALSDPHPIAAKRVESVFLADPTVQGALGCNPAPGQTACANDPRKVPRAPIGGGNGASGGGPGISDPSKTGGGQ